MRKGWGTLRNQSYGIENIKKKTKRTIVSAVCVLGILAVCLGIAGYNSFLKADETNIVTRGVLKDIKQIPQTKKDLCKNNADDYKDKLGTKENPFLILEIVPYKEYATFGYHISGCEPIDVSGFGHLEPLSFVQDSIKTGTYKKETAYFFEEEPEADPKNYDGVEGDPKKYWEHKGEGHDGYFECVEDGKGTFVQNADGSIDTTKVVKNGNIIWHTLSEEEEKNLKNEDGSITFSKAEDPKKKLTKVGERLYTQRLNTNEDPVWITFNYYSCYKNNDDFLLNTMKLSKKEASDYSIVIKTITPEELNKQPEWVDYADLFFINRHQFLGVDLATGVWKKYNKYHEKTTMPDGEKYDDSKNNFVNTEDNKNRDISWTVAKNIFYRVTDEKNYAGLVMGNSLYKIDNDCYKNARKDSTKIPLFDWNLKSVYFPSTGKDVTIDSGMKSNNNVYKLAVMLTSMDPTLFRKIYMDKENPLIKDGEVKDGQVKEGKFTLRTGDDSTYWSMRTFWLMQTTDESVMKDPYNCYFKLNDMWKNYGIITEMESDEKFGQVWVKGHLYGFNDNNSLTFEYGQGTANANQYLDDYQEYLNEYYGSKENHGGTPADAVRYILGDRTKRDADVNELKILDIEPCYDSKNGYSLTEGYLRLMIPKFKGKLSITHMTTAEFIGSSEDLNSTYNLIFMGLDQGAYNLKDETVATYKDENEKEHKRTEKRTIWNDSSMNGYIYFHTGDKMVGANKTMYSRNRSVEFLWDPVTKKNISGQEMRFPGNDITVLKENELVDFLKAGYPIVTNEKLYNTEKGYIDKYSNIYDFITKNRANTTIYMPQETSDIYNAVKKSVKKVEFTHLPEIYNGDTGDGVKVVNANYLERDSSNRSMIRFNFKINDDSEKIYSYKLYIDQNRDGKFTKDEICLKGDKFKAGSGEKTVTYKLSKFYYGLVQWKIEVYQVNEAQTEDDSVRVVQSGCSSAKNMYKSQDAKKEINVLQIMPKGGSYKGKLDLANNEHFKKYYDNLEDYKIKITVKTVEDIQKTFKEKPFTGYNYSEILDETSLNNIIEKLSVDEINLYDYDMYIIGFGDTYGDTNIKNTYGFVDFLKFYIASGKSILFTHDLTSMHNTNEEDFGYSANTLMRDLMGMNRYKSISQHVSDKGILENYQKQFTYDTVTDITNGATLNETHGFTYFAMKRLGWPNKTVINEKTGEYQRMPYYYMIFDAKSGNPVCPHNEATLTGFNNGNDITTKVTRLNEGQITQYPFKIERSLTVADTHGQWYQLNMEDPEVTVWYCLADDGTGNHTKDDKVGDGTSSTYSVSPNDAANNYYIYSKGNVFYSGVGHSTINSDMEAKLFINTMVAAYHAFYQAPMIEVLNPEAEVTDTASMNYKLPVAEEYNETEENDSNDYIRIDFSPVELNAVTTELTCSLYYEDGKIKDYIKKIYDSETNKEISSTIDDSTGQEVFKGVENMHKYYFYYPKKYLKKWKDEKGEEKDPRHTLTMYIRNNKAKLPRHQKLDISVQALFLLD